MGTAVFKWILIIAALLFADWLIMVFVGYISGLCHATQEYFCTVYCFKRIGLLTASAMIIGYLILKKKIQE